MSRIYKDIKDYGLGIFLGILAMAILLLQFGQVCLLVLILGIPCPACGMTRAFFLLFQGQFLESIKMHPLLPMVIIGVIIMAIFRYICKKPFPNWKIYVILFLVLLVLTYGYRMYYFFPYQAPMNYNEGNLIHGIIVILQSMINSQ